LRADCQAELEAAQAQVDAFDARMLTAREQVRVAEQQAALAQTGLDDTVIRGRMVPCWFPVRSAPSTLTQT
jgi:multidrug resistance efflux pump